MKYKSPYGSTDPNASYVDKDVPGAVAGSKVPRQAVEAPQRELHNLILKSGLEPSHEDVGQVAKALQTGKVIYATAGGSPNALTAALDPVPAALAVGMQVRIKIAANNTGAATLNVNGLGVKSILSVSGRALLAGDLGAGRIADLIYDGTAWQLSGLTNVFLGGFQAVSASGVTNWVVPAGVYRARVRVWGGGGGGGGSFNAYSAATGGGGGGYTEGDFAVTPGQTIAVTVGAGGAAGTAGGGNGGNAGTSSFGALCSATGGLGGKGASSGTSGTPELRQDAGAGGTGTGGIINISGAMGNGSYGTLSTALLVGGVGGSSFQGSGSRITVNGAGAPGNFAGDGGGGATANVAGGAGRAGRVEIYF